MWSSVPSHAMQVDEDSNSACNCVAMVSLGTASQGV